MYRYFKCNVLGGFRLSDLNKSIKQGECFFVETKFCESSRAVKAALQAKWMTEITEKEASQFVSIPKKINAFVDNDELEQKRKVLNQVIVPNASDINEKLESRQAGRNFKRQTTQKQSADDKPIMPNFNEAEKTMKIRQADITSKGPDEVLQSPVEAKKENTVRNLAKEISEVEITKLPNFDEKEEVVEKVSTRRRRRTIESTTETEVV